MPSRLLTTCLLAGLIVAGAPGTRADQQIPGPEQFFGFPPGAAGELARYPRVLEYFQLIANTSDRVTYERVGETTMGNDYSLVTISAPDNLVRLDRLVEINTRLAPNSAEEIGLNIGHKELCLAQTVFFINIKGVSNPLNKMITGKTVHGVCGKGKVGVTQGMAH